MKREAPGLEVSVTFECNEWLPSGVWAYLVKRLAGNRCERCGATDTYFHAHHKDGRGQGKGENNRLSNGECLCARCHRRAHSNERVADPLPIVNAAEVAGELMDSRPDLFE